MSYNRERVISSLEKLSMPENLQIEFVKGNHLPLEDLRLQLEDGSWEILNTPAPYGEFSETEAAEIRKIVDHIFSIPEEDPFWGVEGLGDKRWQDLRKWAADLADTLRNNQALG
jgi:hypothetical protein